VKAGYCSARFMTYKAAATHVANPGCSVDQVKALRSSSLAEVARHTKRPTSDA